MAENYVDSRSNINRRMQNESRLYNNSRDTLRDHNSRDTLRDHNSSNNINARDIPMRDNNSSNNINSRDNNSGRSKLRQLGKISAVDASWILPPKSILPNRKFVTPRMNIRTKLTPRITHQQIIQDVSSQSNVISSSSASTYVSSNVVLSSLLSDKEEIIDETYIEADEDNTFNEEFDNVSSSSNMSQSDISSNISSVSQSSNVSSQSNISSIAPSSNISQSSIISSQSIVSSQSSDTSNISSQSIVSSQSSDTSSKVNISMINETLVVKRPPEAPVSYVVNGVMTSICKEGDIPDYDSMSDINQQYLTEIFYKRFDRMFELYPLMKEFDYNGKSLRNLHIEYNVRYDMIGIARSSRQYNIILSIFWLVVEAGLIKFGYDIGGFTNYQSKMSKKFDDYIQKYSTQRYYSSLVRSRPDVISFHKDGVLISINLDTRSVVDAVPKDIELSSMMNNIVIVTLIRAALYYFTDTIKDVPFVGHRVITAVDCYCENMITIDSPVSEVEGETIDYIIPRVKDINVLDSLIDGLPELINQWGSSAASAILGYHLSENISQSSPSVSNEEPRYAVNFDHLGEE